MLYSKTIISEYIAKILYVAVAPKSHTKVKYEMDCWMMEMQGIGTVNLK